MTTIQRRRVVITGMGTVNPCGNTVAETWENLLAGRSGIGLITKFDVADYACKIAGQVKDFNPDLSIDRKEQKKMDLFIQYAMAASQEAMRDSGLGELSKAERELFGVSIGSGIGGLSTIWEEANGYRGPRRTSPFFIPSLIINLASGFVSIKYGLQGPNAAMATACATGTHAIGDAARQIMFGYADRMIAGGSDSVINPLGVGGFGAMRALSTRNEAPQEASRPFDKGRDGFVMAEGAGIVVMEEYELAKARGAKIYAEVCGYGMSGDAHHITSPSEDGDGPRRVMAAAIKDAGITPEQVGYANAHGTSTPAGDRIECSALRGVFGAHAAKLKVSSTKSMTGHLLGAAGGLETIVSALVASTGRIPPTINVVDQDPDCDLDVTANAAGTFDGEYVLNNNFGFGGTNGCLVLRKI
ncbi:3-oxoacyl-[acyl-carrier-protein] synthase 2 [Mesoterricola silvestris]|uniref:3-oxoacyl-[acyl-carrier-protein] synthase 2 n=1 Tax=Mesoterricola silvestris TaxID=2927979 RepID=A0AA48GXS6_9BACT|nr:beta-ketoacyl-ACP synthase II [Mesoterricola silvestris]BDU73831.1 3-oxoacyl-[acyl-carrier-protein] synthase 2 [Mesoterricola silvestris]